MGDGVLIQSPSESNTIGGTANGTANVISGNMGDGVEVANSVTAGNVIAGNFIGTDITGSYALENGGDGVLLMYAGGIVIGGTISGAGNVIAGNTSDGIEISGEGAGPFGSLVAGNYIGTDITGTIAIANGTRWRRHRRSRAGQHDQQHGDRRPQRDLGNLGGNSVGGRCDGHSHRRQLDRN